MSVLEKKALAFEKLAALQNEDVIDEILEHLEKLNSQAKSRIYNLSGNAEALSQQYNETLKEVGAMILLEDILALHQFSIDKFGGGNGVREMGSLESAIARPFQTFGGEDLYPTIFEKSAALAESLIVNHPFVDGNKRTGFLAMASLLKEDGVSLTATEEEAYSFVIEISTGAIKFEEIVDWLKKNVLPLNKERLQLSLQSQTKNMKKAQFLFPVVLFIAVACNNSKTSANNLEKQADSLYKDVMHGHDIGMAKGQAIEKATELAQRAIDSISKLPAAAQLAAAGYKQQLDSLLKDLNYADFSMNKWMEEMKWDPSKIKLEERIKYYTDEKMKVEKVKDAILNSLAKADSLFKTKF